MGGMQRVSLQLVETFSQRSDVSLVAIGQEAAWKNIGVKTTFFLLDLYVRLPLIVQEHKADVVLFSSMVTAALAPLLRNRITVPMVTINHGKDVTLPVGLYQGYVPRIFRALDGVISVSSATREACIKRGMDPAKGVALPNGFSTPKSRIPHDRNASREKLGQLLGCSLDGKFVLLTTGRLIQRKGHEWFLNEVIEKLKSPVVYVVIGDGEQMPAIRRAAERSSRADSIYLLGRQPDEIMELAYHAADLFVMPNIPVKGDMEGFGVVMLEANLAGTPVVASDLEGIKDVVENGRNGYKCPPLDAVTFASTIDRVLQDELTHLSACCVEYVYDQFTWDNVAGRYVQYLQSLYL